MQQNPYPDMQSGSGGYPPTEGGYYPPQGYEPDPNAYGQQGYAQIDPNAYANYASDPNVYAQQGYAPDPNAYAQQGYAPDPNGYTQQEYPQIDPNAYAAQANEAYGMGQNFMTQQEMQYQSVPFMGEPAAKPTKSRPRKKKPLKHQPISPLKRFLLIALVLAVGFSAYKLFFQANRSATATVRLGLMSDERSGDALIVRNETVFNEEGVQEIEYVAQEGAVVSRGDVICHVYSTGYSAKEQNALQGFRNTIRDYEDSLTRSEVNRDQEGVSLDNAVKTSTLDMRRLVQGAAGNLIKQENDLQTAITKRQNYYRIKYSTDMKLMRMFEDESRQELSIESWIKSKVASQNGVVSFYTDGYEAALTPADYDSYSPTNVRAMISGKKPEVETTARGKTNLYRLITKLDQYVVLMLMSDTHWEPRIGSTYKLRLEQFSDTVVDARVLSSTRSGGELLVRLAVIGDVSDVLYMRSCTAVLGEYAESLTVPKGCLYKKNETDGVVIVRDGGKYFVPVSITRIQKNDAYITPVQPGTLSEGDTVLRMK